MFGWRARLGLLIPLNNTVIEPELWQALPDGVTIHGHRFGIRTEERKEDYMDVMRADATESVVKLGPVDCAAYCSFSTSIYKGLSWDQSVASELGSRLGKPVTTAATAMVRALNALKIKKVAVATPYKAATNEKLRAFLSENGLQVTGMKALDPAPSPEEIILLPSAVAYGLAKGAVQTDSDGVFICATDLAAMRIIEPLEKDLCKPVVSTNQAILWDMLRIVRVTASINGFGSLLENLSEPRR